ncbi:MAG TPA: TldD/PmbA family protein [Gemmatimonadaceae bacterium]|nr:TldD/PmbA family protein [Gemmatimonadaceae bacterium]
MALNRRDFLRGTAAAAAASALASAPLGALTAPRIRATTEPGDPLIRELALRAVDAARQAGAEYADARIAQNRSQSVSTRERRVQGLSDNETFGIGVRALVNGAWGFAATSELTPDAVAAVARQAVAQAKANRAAMRRPVTLAPAGAPARGEWRSPIKVDPFDVPLADKVALLLAANEAALGVKGARFVNSGMSFLREEKTFANTDGALTVQTLYRASPSMNITAVAPDNSDFQTRQSTDVQPMGRGYEHVTESDFVGNASRWADEAVQKLSAKPVDVGRYDLVLHPTHLWLTIHESIAHPTELDRVLGYEANYAGTSFVSPPEDVLGKLRYGPPTMNIQADRNQPGSLAACGWDDEGIEPETYHVIRDGVVVDYQTTREQAPYLAWWYESQGKPVRSHGNSYAQSWADVQFQRMPNISLMPGTQDLVWEDLIAATDRGIAIVGDGSFSIDQQRYNAQFAGQLFYEIRGGKIVGMLKDVAYQMRTPEFWAAMDMLGGPRSYLLCGSSSDGKGQPSQSNAVSHGCVPTRHRQINVINTGRTA